VTVITAASVDGRGANAEAGMRRVIVSSNHGAQHVVSSELGRIEHRLTAKPQPTITSARMIGTRGSSSR
jgi:hypothetical protein